MSAMRCHRPMTNGGPESGRPRALFGAAIRQARVGSGLSQRALANLAGLNQSTICRIEAGTIGGLRYATLMRVLLALDVIEIRMVATPWFVRMRA
jgi:transcriptional regulator with XRE-family HTH domain